MDAPPPWKFLRDDAGQPSLRPYVTTSGLAIGPDGRFPILYRSDKVRSAKNCWSLPSGLHEIGTTFAQQFAVELKEELNLDVDTSVRPFQYPVCVYENIAPQDGFHWVIAVLVTPVSTLATLINREPDKHSEIRQIHYNDLMSAWFHELPWAPGLGQALKEYAPTLYAEASEIMRQRRGDVCVP